LTARIVKNSQPLQEIIISSPDIYQSVSQIAQHGVSITKETPSETVDALIQSFSNLSNGLREAIQAATADKS
jgi:hypothetical protein